MTLYGEHHEMRKIAYRNSVNVAAYAKRSPHEYWSYLGLGCEKKLYGTELMSINQTVNETKLLKS